MKKLLTTLALTLGLLFGSVVAISPASADDHLIRCADVVDLAEFTGECDDESTDTIRCSDVPDLAEFTGVCDPEGASMAELLAGTSSADRPAPAPAPAAATCTADQTANDYRAQVAALTAKVDRLQTVADRRAKTIKRLRAKIRKLR